MGASSSILKPQELTEFRKLNTSIENIEIPARPESRSVTDRKGFLFFGVPILIFLPLLIYTLVHVDFRRYHYDYDHCANMCGQKNEKIADIACSGVDYTDKPFSIGNGSSQACVKECPIYKKTTYVPRRCVDPKVNKNEKLNIDNMRYRRDLDLDLDDFDMDDEGTDFPATMAQMRKQWWKFIIVILIAIGLSLMMLYLLRFTPGVLIWGILILSLLFAIAATGGLWYAYSKAEKDNKTATLAAAAAFTIFTIIVLLIFLCLFRKIRLVIMLFKEATKAVFAMPQIILVPVLITILQIIVLVACAATTTFMITSRQLKKHSDTWYEYEMNGAMVFTLIFNIVMLVWTMTFISGFQYMTIAGSVATWFFAKNKQYLGSPIGTSLHNAVRYHTGTVCFGSFILILMAIIKALIKSLDNDKLRCVLECCCTNVEAFLKFLSKNAYIETAIHGQSFLRSGKRAAKLLISNAGSLIAINSVGDFVLAMIEFLIVVITTGISVALFKNIHHFWLPTLLSFIIAVIIAAVVFAVFETTIDTLFICFCEDKAINDGISRPYYMSRGLMEFVESSKKVYGDK